MATRIDSAGYRLKHGIHEVTRAVKALGTNRALDRRTTTDKALARWRDELIADLGGNVSTAKDAIISLAVKTKLILDSIDVTSERGRFYQLSESGKRWLTARYLAMLGLERRHKVKTVTDALNGQDEAPASAPIVRCPVVNPCRIGGAGLSGATARTGASSTATRYGEQRHCSIESASSAFTFCWIRREHRGRKLAFNPFGELT